MDSEVVAAAAESQISDESKQAVTQDPKPFMPNVDIIVAEYLRIIEDQGETVEWKQNLLSDEDLDKVNDQKLRGKNTTFKEFRRWMGLFDAAGKKNMEQYTKTPDPIIFSDPADYPKARDHKLKVIDYIREKTKPPPQPKPIPPHLQHSYEVLSRMPDYEPLSPLPDDYHVDENKYFPSLPSTEERDLQKGLKSFGQTQYSRCEEQEVTTKSCGYEEHVLKPYAADVGMEATTSKNVKKYGAPLDKKMVDANVGVKATSSRNVRDYGAQREKKVVDVDVGVKATTRKNVSDYDAESQEKLSKMSGWERLAYKQQLDKEKEDKLHANVDIKSPPKEEKPKTGHSKDHEYVSWDRPWDCSALDHQPEERQQQYEAERPLLLSFPQEERKCNRGFNNSQEEQGCNRGFNNPQEEQRYNKGFNPQDRHGYNRGFKNPQEEQGYNRGFNNPQEEQGYNRGFKNPQEGHGYNRGFNNPQEGHGYNRGFNNPQEEHGYNRGFNNPQEEPETTTGYLKDENFVPWNQSWYHTTEPSDEASSKNYSQYEVVQPTTNPEKMSRKEREFMQSGRRHEPILKVYGPKYYEYFGRRDKDDDEAE